MGCIMKKTKFTDRLKDFLVLTGGTLLFTFGIYFFKFPNHFSTGGVSGISVLFGALTPYSPGIYTLVINMVLLLLGFLILGKGFGAKTIYCCILQSVLTFLLERLYPMEKPFTDDPFFELFISIFLTAAGSAVLFNADASTGGTDIVAMIIKKYTSFNISKALFVTDCLIVMASYFVFGIRTWLYCAVGFFLKVFLINNMLESINMSKFCIITIRPELEEKICTFITDTLHRSATVSESFVGAYMKNGRSVLFVVLNNQQTILLKKYVRELDSQAFIVVTNSSDICGKGFRETM